MEPTNPQSSEKQQSNNDELDDTQKQPIISLVSSPKRVEQNFITAMDTLKMVNVRVEVVTTNVEDEPQEKEIVEDKRANVHPEEQKIASPSNDTQKAAPDSLNTSEQNNSEEFSEDVSRNILDRPSGEETSVDTAKTNEITVPETPIPEELIEVFDFKQDNMHIDTFDTGKLVVGSISSPPPFHPPQAKIKRGTAVLIIALLAIVVLHGLTLGPTQFLGSQGWASVLGNSSSQGNPNLLLNINKQIVTHSTKPGSKVTVKAQMTPSQYIDLIVNRMTLDQKLGQMMIVQFVGANYDLPISTMISQYNVGAVLVFTANGNVVDKDQLTSLIKQMKSNSTTIPLAIAIDQEGGTVDRLTNLDGPRPAASTIGATNNPTQARQAGIQDAKDLTSYGFNLNLAPVVDVTNVYNAQMDGRTFGDTPGQVTKMAGAYLKGLQQSGKVVGTLKHFPGLGDVATDPHLGIPQLTRSKNDLEKIDWAPYRALIRSGNVHAIMVTHEIVAALDATEPSSLSPKIIQGILRKDLGFQGVVMTDSLTMDALSAYATEYQAAVLAIEAGADLLMGAASPEDVAAIFQNIKQAMSTGTITEQRINESVHRILMMKYAMGLLPIPKN